MIKWFKDLFDYRAKYKASIQQRLFNEDADREAAQQALIILQKYEALTASLPPEHELSTQMYWKDYADKRLMRENANLLSTLNKLREDHASMTNLWIENISRYGVQMYGKWQPIELAPTDGVSCYLIYGKDEDGIECREVCAYIDGEWDTGSKSIQATHWMPLPEKLND